MAACIKREVVVPWMGAPDRRERALEHLKQGEQLVDALRGMIDDQKAAGISTEATERLLRGMLTTIDRLRASA